jgi:hypothetical protein
LADLLTSSEPLEAAEALGRGLLAITGHRAITKAVAAIKAVWTFPRFRRGVSERRGVSVWRLIMFSCLRESARDGPLYGCPEGRAFGGDDYVSADALRGLKTPRVVLYRL